MDDDIRKARLEWEEQEIEATAELERQLTAAAVKRLQPKIRRAVARAKFARYACLYLTGNSDNLRVRDASDYKAVFMFLLLCLIRRVRGKKAPAAIQSQLAQVLNDCRML